MNASIDDTCRLFSSGMDEQVHVLQAIYCRPNEITYDDLARTMTYHAFDEQEQVVGFSATVYENELVVVHSDRLTKEELRELRTRACLTTTMFDLFSTLKELYDELMTKRTSEPVAVENDKRSTILMKIDHMRSPSLYMKHLRQWTNELNVTGRVLAIPHGIYILVEGANDDLKVCWHRRALHGNGLRFPFRNSSLE